MPFIPHTEGRRPRHAGGHRRAPTSRRCSTRSRAKLRVRGLPGVPPALSEMEVGRLMSDLAARDGRPLNFIGAGAYEHHIPAAVWAIVTRGEFYSAYTPYQAEASQGTLQLLYEYQTMMASLTGTGRLERVALRRRLGPRRSLPDGGARQSQVEVAAHPAAGGAESDLPRRRAGRRRQPEHRASNCCRTTRRAGRRWSPRSSSTTARTSRPSCIQQPNFFGALEDVDALTDWAHANNALVIGVVQSDRRSRVLKPPGEWGAKGADIACGDGQPLGVPLVLGWPVLRLHGHAHGARAADAGPHRRPHASTSTASRVSR